MVKKLKDKVAIVTGASKGIGASIAENLAAEGAAVTVNYSTSKEGADRVVDKIVKAGGKAVSIQGDVTHQAEVQRLFSETKKAFGRLDILINNAGVYEFASLEEITAEHFHKMFNLNVLGLLFASQEAVKYFPEKGGSIVNISSVASTIASPNTSVYGATKAAVDVITKTLSKELGGRNIRVNAVNPGVVETERLRSMGILESDFLKEIKPLISLGRLGKPQDIASTVVFLVSDDASWITGEAFIVSGGLR